MQIIGSKFYFHGSHIYIWGGALLEKISSSTRTVVGEGGGGAAHHSSVQVRVLFGFAGLFY